MYPEKTTILNSWVGIPGLGRSAEEEIGYLLQYSLASLVAQQRIRLQCGRPGFNPWVGRSLGEGKGSPLQYSGLENSMDCIVYGVAKSQIQLSNFHLCCIAQQLKAFAMPYCISESHSVVSDWRGGGWDDLGEWH